MAGRLDELEHSVPSLADAVPASAPASVVAAATPMSLPQNGGAVTIDGGKFAVAYYRPPTSPTAQPCPA